MFLGIDIGTSSVKAALIDEAGRQVEVSQAELPISRPKPLWSEQNPSDWWTATNMAVAKLDVNRRHRVKAVGLSGQMHGATLLDESLAPIRPAILWNDGRSFEECRDLQKSTPAFVSKGGNLVMPGFTAPKLEWVRRHEPGAFEKVHKVLLPKDYVRLRMTGDLASDMSDSSGTLWMDVEARTWSEELLAACGLTIDHMPKLYEGHEVTGVLRQEAAEAWGMDRVPVVAGGGDNAAGAAGVGVIDEGEALLSLGTSGVIFVAGNTFRSNPDSAAHAFCHALPDRWHLMSVMLSAASCLDWAVKLTGTSDAGELVIPGLRRSAKPCLRESPSVWRMVSAPLWNRVWTYIRSQLSAAAHNPLIGGVSCLLCWTARWFTATARPLARPMALRAWLATPAWAVQSRKCSKHPKCCRLLSQKKATATGWPRNTRNSVHCTVY